MWLCAESSRLRGGARADCHGLPVEFEIDKKLGISGRDDVLKMGIKAYNAECRAIVMRYSKEWEATVKRVGRWIDFENDYKTMNLTFMETVWWVFGQLHEKGLVYRGFKVMPYSCACNTPLSNFEVQQNYKVCHRAAAAAASGCGGAHRTPHTARCSRTGRRGLARTNGGRWNDEKELSPQS